MILKVKKLVENAILPSKKRDTDEGYDLYAHTATALFSGVTKVHTGIAAWVEPSEYDFPQQFWLQIEGRSGLASKGIFPVGGVVDIGYTGEIIVLLANVDTYKYMINAGDKIAQLVIRSHHHAVITEVTEVMKTDRGDKGFGSSGN